MKEKLFLLLIVLLCYLSQFSETAYTSAFPMISIDLNATPTAIQWTMSIYLFGIAIGGFIFSVLSDKFGRKLCILFGLITCFFGSIGCYFSNSIESLMFFRFVQSFGASAGSVLWQAVIRDKFTGNELGKAYSTIGASLGLIQGPLVGALIIRFYEWPAIFLFLAIFALLLFFSFYAKFDETNFNRVEKIEILPVFSKMVKDKKVIGFGLIIGLLNGINFSFFNEGPFYLIEILKMDRYYYKYIIILISFSVIFGGLISRRMHRKFSTDQILLKAISLQIITTLLFFLIVLSSVFFAALSNNLIKFVFIFVFIIFLLNFIISPCALSIALRDYQKVLGVAGAIFGLFYYLMISFFTFIMGLIHNSSLITMPMYFFLLALLMFLVKQILIVGKQKIHV